MNEQTMIFNLSEPLEFSKKGDFETTLSLEIAPPATQHYNLVMALAQKVTKAMLEAQRSFSGMASEQAQEDQSSEMNADAIKMMFLSASIPISDYIDPLARLLERTCTLDGEFRLTAGLFDKIGIQDKTKLLCEYVLNFIVPLAL